MMDAQIKNATCQIKCGEASGTGWLISASQVVTARHCIDEAIDGDIQIEVQFEIGGVAQHLTAALVDDDKALDVCLLLLEREVDIAPMVVDAAIPVEGSRFSSFGFPVAKLSVGHRFEGEISRILESPKLGIDLDLQVEGPGQLSSYEGISGAALICNGSCRGMLRLAIDKSLAAVSIARIAEFLHKNSIALGDISEERISDCTFAPREEFTQAFDALISNVVGGYAFIEGAHGIGKSTFCETYQPSLQTIEHFGTYSFTTQDVGANSMHLAQPEVFFDWLNTLVSSHLPGQAMRASEKRYPELIAGVNELINLLAQAYSSQGKIGVVFLDGIDEVSKLGQGILERLVGLLPSRMPTGLIFVISAPSYVNLSAALGSRLTGQACIRMPGLERNASRAFCASALLPERSSDQTIRIICDKAQGHALYLRYLIDLANGGVDDAQLTALPLIDGSIRNYYETLWPQLLADSEAVNLLAVVARLRWGISTEQLADILNDAERSVLVSTISRIQHLLLRRDETTIYHASFTDFLTEKTAVRELDVQHRLTNYCFAHPKSRYAILNTVYHGLRAGPAEEARAIGNCSQQWVDRCVMLGAKPDTLLGDVHEVLAAAAKQGSLVEVVRILLLTQRIQFRYDTLFALSADLAVDALVALGKTKEALQHAVRYGRLIIPVHQTLRLALQLMKASKSDTALDILDKAEAVVERQLSGEKLTIGNFIKVFKLRTQILLLRGRAGDKSAMRELPNFYGMSIDAVRSSVEDEKICNDLLSDMTTYFSGSMACLAGRYLPLSLMRKYYSGSNVKLSQMLLGILENYQFFCSYFDVAHNHRLLSAVFSDLQTLVVETPQEQERSSLGAIDALVSLKAPTSIVLNLTGSMDNLGPIQFVAEDNINMDADSFASGMAQWRLASLLDKEFPCPVTSEIQISEWREGVESICRALAWCEGAARRAKEAGDGISLSSVWATFGQHVLKRLRFTLAQRSQWSDSYALPEAVFPEIYEHLTVFVMEVFPEHLNHVLSFIEAQFEVQCGLYSEGFRSILAKVFKRLTKLILEEEIEDQAYALLKRWRNFVQSNVKNRHELVPELLAIIPFFVRLNAAEDAHLTYQTALSFSMGPSWYKEDQLSLMTGVLKLVPQGEPLESGILSRIAGCLEIASGEMTFQRFVRYDKADLLGILCQRADYLKAVRYFMRQSCGSAEQLLAEATESVIDRISPLRGMRFPGGAIDEQDALYRMLKSAAPAADWPIYWALLEIYQYGDARHLQESAKLYAHLAAQAKGERGAHTLMVERLRIICEDEFDSEQRAEFVSVFQDNLPPDLLQSFEEILDEATFSTKETSRFDLPHNNVSDCSEGGEATLDSFVIPGMFGSQASSQESEEALARAERQLARGNSSAARAEAVKVLEHSQQGGWSIWSDLSPVADRAEAILRDGAISTDTIVKAYAPLILAERYADKWQLAAYLIKTAAIITTQEERAKLLLLAVEHIETIVGDIESKQNEYQFLEESPVIDEPLNLIELILTAVEHPKWFRRDKAAELILWLLDTHPQYIPVIGPNAFTMVSGNLPDVLCGMLDHLSTKNAVRLWEKLAPALDLDKIKSNCRHIGRLAVLLRIAERAAKKGSETGEMTRELVSAVLSQTRLDAVDVETPSQAQCPEWALTCEEEWQELTVMGLATDELVERANTAIKEACAPLSIETSIELEQLLAEGFSDHADHPLGRWKAKVRYALQVALLPSTTMRLLSRVTQIFSNCNPSPMADLRIFGFSSPSTAWLAALNGAQGGFMPTRGSEVYVDFYERVWVGNRYRSLRLTMFFYRSGERPLPPTSTTDFLSTQLPALKGTSEKETCAIVDFRYVFFGGFTPAIPSDALMRMTRATGDDLNCAHWRVGRTSLSKGGGPLHEGCFLAIKHSALRLPQGIEVAWVYELDGQQRGIISQSS
ncbi:AVAST type 1 anti-phage system protease Avs1b [Rheinheimera oceanensis]|uniref:AVAST type 1 anti-phage system protease Avs1b n=1 Tax=Rheinheimera oceanensis TaxID=2817449 RepID=UPI001BFD9154|nr:AVAST type 1 anti-phage system protease Avs1b [Rheinheimera oceanensis]